ncbi:MAG: class III extradiol ring-cleavage dioxygenase, partial [Pseudomonadota bacterium]
MTKASSRQQPASIFVSHGSPDLVLHNTEAKRFLEGASSDFPRPHAIVSVSAHFETAIPTIVTDPSPEMIYDFRGFDSRLREIVYSAPGSASIGEKISALLSEAGIDHDTIEKRGFDHGTWVPLSLLYPQADIPVVQLSVQPH